MASWACSSCWARLLPCSSCTAVRFHLKVQLIVHLMMVHRRGPSEIYSQTRVCLVHFRIAANPFRPLLSREQTRMEIGIVCVPFQSDMGRWGMARGPQAVLEAGLIARLHASGHPVAEPIWIEFPNSERTRDTVTNLVRIAARTSAAVRSVLARDGAFALVLEGNCAHALGPMGGIAGTGAVPGVVWFDAHGDMNTMATTTSGMWGGMPDAVALGWDLDDWREAAGLREPVRPEAAALVGASDLDPAEIAALEHHPILRMDAAEMQAPGVAVRW